jgi:hypothetical protein
MPSTSGTYNFQSIQIELIIREAFERIGILGEFVEPQKLDSAKRSLDLLFLEWMNKSVNLWTLQSTYLPLVTSQAKYTLPVTVSNIIQANLRTSTRQLNGVAQTNTANTYDNGGGGTAAFAFDGNPATACTQTVTNGNISYDYGEDVTQQINFVGIQSNTNTFYTLVVESSQDTTTWTTLFTIPAQNFVAGVNTWFDIPTPIQARTYRIRETGGQTLNIQEIYFNNNLNDFQISDVSRSEYLTYPNKQLQSRPSVYYLDRQITPILYIWPVPTPDYNCLFYSYKEMIQDTGNFYTNAVQVPSRFYPALIWGLSWHLALKFNPQAAGMLQAEYEKSFNTASREDTEGTEIKIYGDYQDYELV